MLTGNFTLTEVGEILARKRGWAMFLIAKTALVTCAFYLGISILLEAVLLGLTFLKGGMMYSLSFKLWALVFGPIWLGSFALSWRFTTVPYVAKFPSPLR